MMITAASPSQRRPAVNPWAVWSPLL